MAGLAVWFLVLIPFAWNLLPVWLLHRKRTDFIAHQRVSNDRQLPQNHRHSRFLLSEVGCVNTVTNVHLTRLTYCSGYSSAYDTCVSRITTAISTSLCVGDAYVTSSTMNSPNSSFFSFAYFTPVPFTLRPPQPAITAQASVLPVYMIHQQSDIPSKGLSTKAKIAIGVVVPVVVLLAIGLGGLLFMRKARRKGAHGLRPSAIPLTGVNARKVPKGGHDARSAQTSAAGRKWHWV